MQISGDSHFALIHSPNARRRATRGIGGLGRYLSKPVDLQRPLQIGVADTNPGQPPEGRVTGKSEVVVPTLFTLHS